MGRSCDSVIAWDRWMMLWAGRSVPRAIRGALAQLRAPMSSRVESVCADEVFGYSF